MRLQGVCRSHQPGGAVPQLRQHAAERLPHQLRGHGAEAVRPAGRRNLLRSPAAHRGSVGRGRPDSFRAAVLRGRDVLCAAVSWTVQRGRLVRALSGVHPMELYRVSRDNPAKLPGWRRYVYPIYTTYNGKCRKGCAADEVLNSNISFGKGDGTRKKAIALYI